MYSHGSYARAGVGRRGPGGREYRAPKPRRDLSLAPPPMKKCSCLIQFDLPEYYQTATAAAASVNNDNNNNNGNASRNRRHHLSFGGREAVEDLERKLRSVYQVHLVVPGRNQSGPVAIVGATYHQTVLAAVQFLRSVLALSTSLNDKIPGRIQRHVQDPNDRTVEGSWSALGIINKLYHQQQDRDQLHTNEVSVPSGTNLQLHWVFHSPDWSILVCELTKIINTTPATKHSTSKNSGHQINEKNGSMSNEETLQILTTCVDNFEFSTGSAKKDFEYFLHDNDKSCIIVATGKHHTLNILYQEIVRALSTKEEN